MALEHKDMLKLVKKGIGPTKFSGAFRDGNYLGNPGKDLYFWIESDPSEEQMQELAIVLADQFPKNPSHNPIEYGACIRYIYGMFEKQGVLRSPADKKRMIKEQQSWRLSEPFINFFYKAFENKKRYFGLAILCEQIAHRLGDEHIMKGESLYLDKMEQYYCDCYKFSKKCRSNKHLMTTFYWAGRYFAEAGQSKKAIEYYRRAVKAANLYCPDARKSLQEKIMDEFKYLKRKDPCYKAFIEYWKKHASNKAMRAVVKRVK